MKYREKIYRSSLQILRRIAGGIAYDSHLFQMQWTDRLILETDMHLLSWK